MENFEYHNPVKIIFGKGKTAKIADEIPADAKILMIYGGGSIFKNGVYKQVNAALANHDFIEFGGIEANPTYETSMEALEVVKREKIDFLLAVGGGSVIDATKFIAAAALFNGEPWDILAKGAAVESALPLASVLTLPATGSEMNGNSVISKIATQEKLAFGSPVVMPTFSILDPEFTYSLPKRQVANGIVDAFVHTVEQYLTYNVNSPIQDRTAEAVFTTLIEEGRKAVNQVEPDYETRANLMCAATVALNGQLGVGVKSCWATHQIGHEITAFHGLDHALTLSIVLPGLMQIKRNERAEKILQFGERVWNITSGNNNERIDKTIEATESFFRELGMLTKLPEHNIDESTIYNIVERFTQRKMKAIGVQQDISLDDVTEILKLRL